MLAYAAHRRRVAERHSSPQTLLLIAAAHIALIAAVMSARMDLPARIFEPPIVVTNIPIPKPPPDPAPADTHSKRPISIDHTKVIVPISRPDDHGPDTTQYPPIPGGGTIELPLRGDPLPVTPVRVGPRFATPPSELRPPYPPSKIASEEEAVLRLKLTIGASGRVIAVDSVGKADPAFLAAARRHLMAHWRYKPATEDGRAMASATVITLRFELNE